ncbi:Transcriptional regulator, LysR family [Candidatus Filomicrobium marinum]|uniref:Transcriptional regulator, LysR family n=2 Tax=Candidatus Filomicrobium marinum TaxID=1608628 RepID=A0A0D6JK36_9HYPH|nr:Transcriptional regulator, LysR family [Candidatus Filomicrobium marinum]CPR22311.1 Transcriptional regulator, LysR family [Candidatus Filomicrobium marinum]
MGYTHPHTLGDTAAMTFEQLRIFVAVAERQHVTRAAEALNLSQSAVSHAIGALEARYHTKLFDRVGRRIELTEPGRAFLPEARSILAQTEHAEFVLSEFGMLERGTLRVKASQTIASYWLPRYFANFRRQYPRIDVHLSIGNTAQVADAVETGEAELGFVEGVVDIAHFQSIPVARDQLVVVVAPEHPWAEGRRITPKHLSKSDWALRESGSGTRSAFEHALAQLGVDLASLPIAMELPSNEAVRAAVEAGLGATAISATVAAPSLEVGLLHHVRFSLPEREFHVLRHKERYRSKIGEAFLELMPSLAEPRRQHK